LSLAGSIAELSPAAVGGVEAGTPAWPCRAGVYPDRLRILVVPSADKWITARNRRKPLPAGARGIASFSTEARTNLANL